jgi:hypothetical protein
VSSYERHRRERRSRRRRTLLWLAALVLAFLLGIGLGEALHDGPDSGTQTLVRTLTPLTVPPATGATTVTVTTSNP